MQYQTGTATTTTGSNVITGSDTAWLANATVGDSFKFEGEAVVYTVSAVNADDELEISVNYAGGDKTNANYQIARDFTPNQGYYEPNGGDRDMPDHLTIKTIRKIDTDIAAILARLDAHGI